MAIFTVATSILAAALFIGGSAAPHEYHCGNSDTCNGQMKDTNKPRDIGVNIFGETAGDVLRVSTLHSLPGNIDPTFLNPEYSILIYSHGWQAMWSGDHYTTDQWQPGTCSSDANPGGVEPCPPTEHNAAEYWKKEKFNVIFIDWAWYADMLDVGMAEKKLYADQDGEGNVIHQLHKLLVSLFDKVQWKGPEMRITGNSLGTQVALGLSAKFITDHSHPNYAKALQRIALFDHFMSGKCLPQNGCGVLGGKTPCQHINDVVVPQIRSNPDPKQWPVIENYRTSVVTTSLMAGCVNRELNKKTVFVELTPHYYPMHMVALKHTVGISMYLHSFKWKDKGPVQDGAPSGRMPTSELKAMCPATHKKPYCPKYFQQKAGGKTTWDYDDRFKVKQWTWIGDMGRGFMSWISGQRSAREDLYDEDLYEYAGYDEDEDEGDLLYDQALLNLQRAQRSFEMAKELVREDHHTYGNSRKRVAYGRYN